MHAPYPEEETRMLKYLASLLFLVFLGVPSIAQTDKISHHDWVMHIYVGSRLFEDKLHLEQTPGGQWQGTISVPNLFTVPVRNVSYTKKTISFDIEANEGKGLFHVKYVGSFYPGTDTFSGFATVTDDNSLLGGFVGQKV
jgi:hypothetical protein